MVRWDPVRDVELCPVQDPIVILRDRIGPVLDGIEGVPATWAVAPMLGKAVPILTVPATGTHPNSDVPKPRMTPILAGIGPDVEHIFEAFRCGRFEFFLVRVFRSVTRGPVILLDLSVRGPRVRHRPRGLVPYKDTATTVTSSSARLTSFSEHEEPAGHTIVVRVTDSCHSSGPLKTPVESSADSEKEVLAPGCLADPAPR